jgi:hypothetical protein
VAALLIYRAQADRDSLAFDWNPFEPLSRKRAQRPSSRRIQPQGNFLGHSPPSPFPPPGLYSLVSNIGLPFPSADKRKLKKKDVQEFVSDSEGHLSASCMKMFHVPNFLVRIPVSIILVAM